MLDEFDEEGYNGVGDDDVEGRADPVDTTVDSFSGVLENDKVVENVVEYGVGDEDGHDGGVFPSDEGFPRELEHAAFVEGPFRDEGF